MALNPMNKGLRVLSVLLGLTVFVAFGLVVTRWTVDEGIDRFRADPVAHAIAGRAYMMAWVHRDNPIQRALAPAARVVAVERKPGHCTRRGSPTPEPLLRDYTARVRFYTVFRLPMADVYLTCGGRSASSSPPT